MHSSGPIDQARGCSLISGLRRSLSGTPCLLAALCLAPAAAALEPAELGLVINLNDAYSVQVGEFYAARRAIPAENVVRVRLPAGQDTLSPALFDSVEKTVRGALPERVQGLALAWTQPYRVGCMGITTAFAAGFDEKFCARGCKPTAASPLFGSYSQAPYRDYGWRPAMLLAGRSYDNGRQLIERGIQSDYSRPAGHAYLLDTSDRHRSIRSNTFPMARAVGVSRGIKVSVLERDFIKDRYDVLFYFTGLRQVKHLDRIGFLPGAMADHLTSAGGQLLGDRQMSALRWLEAGATGSYGTAREPCNFPQKFPNPALAMRFYLEGASLLEAYWRSVAWPGQGVFIGEPLARPFATRGERRRHQPD